MNTILEAIKDFDPVLIKNIGVAGAMAIGALVLGVSLVSATISVIWKTIKAITSILKGVACCAIFLGIGAFFTANPPQVDNIEEIKNVVISTVK